ncbi:hypothetical protein B0H17DRAFT_1204533 [Mycena rosella]|uniref:Uncharacterized protein n=1 Tax=Mycena rosella TaxID=1033263 RepID=A0AAD7GF23_MYCRO|nr:hypothetical protein B0H17DRAFT_1204533 [Mycena rosella]
MCKRHRHRLNGAITRDRAQALRGSRAACSELDAADDECGEDENAVHCEQRDHRGRRFANARFPGARVRLGYVLDDRVGLYALVLVLAEAVVGGAQTVEENGGNSSVTVPDASSQDDPFTAGNGHPDFTPTVSEAWAQFFPGIKIADAVYGVAAGALRNWRSEIGERAMKYLIVLFTKPSLRLTTQADIAEYVAAELHDMSFVYRDRAKKCGTYRSNSILDVFAYQLRAISTVPEEERKRASSALSLCTAAMERAFTMWMTGQFIKPQTARSERKSAKNFVAVPWAARAAKYLVQIKSMSTARYEETVASSTALIGTHGGDDNAEESSEARIHIWRSSFRMTSLRRSSRSSRLLLTPQARNKFRAHY